jgi:murein DD-endopeptidase MepM/ murein hydrolase activator NlpD
MTKAERRAAWRRRIIASWHPSGRWGAYNTERLDHAAGRLRDKGWHLRRVARQVYAPFIVIGPANWTDTWGAPRFAGGYHPHTGQDVFCREGAPVLAIQNGKVVYSSNGLGGLTAELFREDGGSWYYAHLSARNKDLASGDPVRTGQVIGFCGHSGDARYSPSHVHFSFHTSAGVALDPMPALVGALRAASTSIGAGERDGGHDLAGNLDPDSALTRAPRPGAGVPEAAAVAAAPTAAEEPFYPRQLVLLALIPPLAIGLPALGLRRRRRSRLRG